MSDTEQQDDLSPRVDGSSRRKHLPSEDLAERKALAARFVRMNNLTAAKLKELTAHAERYGSDGVVETAVELGYDFDACVRLQDACDRADAALIRKRNPRAHIPKHKPSDVRVRLLMGITDDETTTDA